jgi:tetratricopeptide (TPR) repeat protein
MSNSGTPPRARARARARIGSGALARALAVTATAVFASGLSACSSTARVRPARPVAPRLPAADPAALREFDAGMRALRLGGPDAHERAEPRLRRAVELDPKLWEAWHNLGVVYFARGDDDSAVDAYGRALAINAAHGATRLARAEAHRRAGRAGDARADYEAALAADPDDAGAHIRLASLLREQGRLDDALDAAREALRRAPDPRVSVELGMIYLAQGRDDLAALVLEKAIAADAKLPAAWNALALVSLARGKDQEAFERFDHATSLDPQFRDARFNKAAVLLDAGDYAAARAELEAVVRQAPGDLGAAVALGVAERGLGKYDRARTLWDRVVRDAPLRSGDRADALFDLAVLEMDFVRDEGRARAALDRFLKEAPSAHAKRKDAESRRKELGQ